MFCPRQVFVNRSLLIINLEMDMPRQTGGLFLRTVAILIKLTYNLLGYFVGNKFFVGWDFYIVIVVTLV